MADGATAQAQLDAGQVMEARKSINQALAERDDIADLHLLRARIELTLHSYDTAFSAYSNALTLDAGNSEALLGVAQLGLRTGHLQDSEEAADRILTLDPEQPQALLVKGLHNILHHRYEDALKNANGILAKNPKSEDGAVLRARSYAMLGKSEDALNEILTLRKEIGNSFGVAKTLLELYRQKDDAPAMLEQLDLLRKYSPADRSFVFDEANTLYKMGQMERARGLLQRLLFDPRLNDANARLIIDLWKEYDPEPLNPAALAAVGSKADISFRKAVARFYIARNDIERARIALGNGDTDDFTALRAQMDIARGDLAGGLSKVEPILQRDQTHCDALLAKAQATLAERRYDEAIIAGQSAYASCPDMAAAYVVVAKAQEANNNKAAADIAFSAGVDRNVQDSQLARNYTDWLERNGKAMRAISIARRVTKSAPALVSGWKLYQDVCARTPDAGCADDAAEGMTEAKRRFAVDLRPDELAPIGLFVRLERQ